MGFGGISIWQLMIVLVIVLLLFGSKKLRGLGSDLGSAVKGFRGAMSDAEKETETEKPQPSQLSQDESGRVIDSEKAESKDTTKDKTKV